MAGRVPDLDPIIETSGVSAQAVLDVCLCHLTRRAARAISRRYDQALAELNLTANQFTLLAAMAAGPVGIGDLKAMLVTDASTLSRNLSVLRRAGHVSLDGHGGRRAGSLILTESGQDLFVAALPVWQRVQADVTAALGTGRASLLVQGLEAASVL